jgi:hypothetical protein
VPVRSLDAQPIGLGAAQTPGPVTIKLTQAFFEFARSTGTPVPYPAARAAV